MKKNIILTVILLLSLVSAKAQWVTIPDANFVTKLQQLYPSCMNGNLMDTTCSEIVNETSLNVNISGIYDLTGIKYFTSLQILECGANNFTTLPELPSNLIELDCSANPITSLPSLPNSLTLIDCQNCQLTSLASLPNSLKTLLCQYNQLTNIPILPNSLQLLWCYYNELTSLPALPNSLTHLNCHDNQLISLPTLPDSLTKLYCYKNQLTSLPSLPSSLLILSCFNNQLTSLPTLPNSLYSFSCSNNQIISLPTLPNFLNNLECDSNLLTSLPSLSNIYLDDLRCSGNFLTSLPTLPNTLYSLECSHNLLTSLPTLPSTLLRLVCNDNLLVNLPLTPSYLDVFQIQNNNINCLQYLPFVNSICQPCGNISNNPLTCVPNQRTYSLGLPYCIDNDSLNNPNNCISTVNISGRIFTDLNNNCSYNTSDLPSQNIMVNIYDSLNDLVAQNFAIAGTYGFTVNQPGTYKVKILLNNLPLTMACLQADSQFVNLLAINNGVGNINFPIQCNAVTDAYTQSIISQGWVSPGEIHFLEIVATSNEDWYNVYCDSTTNSGTVTIQISGLVSYVAPMTNALTPIVNGNTFTYNISDFNTLTPSSFGLQLMTDTTAYGGDQICVHVEIDPTPIDADTTNNVYDLCYDVQASCDPNMKEVYPVNVLPGYDDWFTYTIHFQNIGTAPAFNVRLRDTLDANLDINSFEVRGYSHPPNILLNGNILTVRFNNIMLPDSTTDYEGSMGYFQYRLKPLPNLPNGTQIENTAYIYFDYNAPIITNTTQNNFDMTVKTNDIKFDEEHYVLYPNPSTGLFMFKDNKNIKTVEVFNMLGELVLSQSNCQYY
jgi:uncharacterized repeat protein (TIGR01451 family)